jgi:hypothetical protein
MFSAFADRRDARFELVGRVEPAQASEQIDVVLESDHHVGAARCRQVQLDTAPASERCFGLAVPPLHVVHRRQQE